MNRLGRGSRNRAIEKNLRRRRRFERRFKAFGLFSVCLGVVCLSLMLMQITSSGIGAFKQTYIYLEVDYDPRVLAMVDPRHEDQMAIADFEGVLRKAFEHRFPVVTDARERRSLASLISVTSSFEIRDAIVNEPELIRQTRGFWLLADDDVDMYFKNRGRKNAYRERLSEQQVAWIDDLAERGEIEVRFNRLFFSAGDSAEPEAAGIRGALMGSVLTLALTLILSFPIGVASAIYLEEYAPNNKLTDFIEVNINNLAAVPSVIFGLLGLAIFLNGFGLPRSVPLVGGMVLTLMTLPTIIISSRAAIKAVPQSLRDAALSMGASKMQVILHHVLPLALPGMLTGTIIGMAQALGETAPLLMIGMVAFIVDIPTNMTDPSTVLPVQIFLWADAPERSFIERSSAAIMVLLALLLTMNSFAVWLRSKLDKRL
ncbi:MAG: phosphate ABC transporter permease PstA [Acidiferrobacterales bacterium]|nr:phosphate ABC transporter permease PstA [Acidiferrobacterales bacterium]